MPSEWWDEEVTNSKTVAEQEWINEVEIDVSGLTTQITNPLETVTNKEITQNLLNQNNNSVTLSNLMTNPSTNYGLTKQSTLIPKLTTLTNQRVTSSTLTVSDILNDNQSLGLSRNSTLVLDPPVYYGDITITEPGQYLPSDFNSQGLYDPTHSAGFEYINQINIEIPTMAIPELKLSEIVLKNNYFQLSSNIIYFTTSNYDYYFGNYNDQIVIPNDSQYKENGTTYYCRIIIIFKELIDNTWAINCQSNYNLDPNTTSTLNINNCKRAIIIKANTIPVQPNINYLSNVKNNFYLNWVIENKFIPGDFESGGDGGNDNSSTVTIFCKIIDDVSNNQ